MAADSTSDEAAGSVINRIRESMADLEQAYDHGEHETFEEYIEYIKKAIILSDNEKRLLKEK